MFHLRCTDIKDAVFKVIRENASILWTCQSCTHERRALTVSMKQALELVSDLSAKLEHLKVTVLKHDKLIIDNTKQSYAQKLTGAVSQKDEKNNDRKKNASKKSFKSQKQSNKSGNKPKSTLSNNKSENINNDTDNELSDSDSDFTPVVSKNKKNKSRDKVIGTATASTSSSATMGCTLQAVARRAHLHVWRLEKATTRESLSAYIEKALDTTDVVVESLQTKGDYASFKVSVDFDLMDKMYDPQLWPKGTSVSRFKFLRTRQADSQ